MILGQLTMGARQTKNAPLQAGVLFSKESAFWLILAIFARIYELFGALLQA